MNRMRIAGWLSGLALLALCCVGGIDAAERMVGGFASASTTKTEVVDAAKFAVQAELKALQATNATARLELVKIVSAEEQVVAGMNYRLKLKVKLDGKEKDADVTVWWQAWRKPEPYELTSWTWL